MGLLDVLASIPRAITEKAQADEFGRDWKERRQRAADVHTQSELENALSNVNLDTKVRGEAARMRELMGGGKYTDPVEAEAARLAEDRALKIRETEAGIKGKEALAGWNEARPDLGYAALEERGRIAAERMDLERQKAEATDKWRAAMIDAKLAQLDAVQARFDQVHGGIGPTITVIDPKNPNGPGIQIDRWTREPVNLGGGLGPQKPLAPGERKEKSALEVVAEQLGDIRGLVAKPNVSGKIGFYSGKMENIRNSGIAAPLQMAGAMDKPDADYVMAQTRLTDIADQLLRARSGAQINEAEYQRLRGLLPDLTSGDITVFNAKMQRFEEDLNRTLAAKGYSLMPGNATPSAVPLPQQYQEGQTATGPGGQKMIFRSGQWVPQ